MTKQTHILSDESLGGIKHEYVEVMRKAEVGDKVIVVSVVQSNGLYKVGDILIVKKYVEEDVNSFEGIEVEISGVITGYFLFPEEYRVLEPTDVVHIDGERYRLVDRKAKAGERVIIVNEKDWDADFYENGEVFSVDSSENDLTFTECGVTLFNDEYRVLEPVEEEKEEKLDVYDLLANLSNRVHKLEKEAERQNASTKEQKDCEKRIDVHEVKCLIGHIDHLFDELKKNLKQL